MSNADAYRQTAANARLIAEDPATTPEMRAACILTAETNERLFQACVNEAAREGKRLPVGATRVRW